MPPIIRALAILVALGVCACRPAPEAPERAAGSTASGTPPCGEAGWSEVLRAVAEHSDKARDALSPLAMDSRDQSCSRAVGAIIASWDRETAGPMQVFCPAVRPDATRRAIATGVTVVEVAVRQDGSVSRVTPLRFPDTNTARTVCDGLLRCWFLPKREGGKLVASTTTLTVFPPP